jgi:pimeloyl-ACP methyl ester carboxylesterase
MHYWAWQWDRMTHSLHTTAAGHRIAYQHQAGSAPGIVFLCGFRSDMESTKATALADWCAQQGIAFTRFDYFGHGKSEGEFRDFTIGTAIADALEILDHVATGDQILVGSSMGGWMALHAALERKSQVRGLVGIAAAPDFTERLMYARATPEQRAELDDTGEIWVHSDYSNNDYPITRNFILEARRHLLLDDIIPLSIPIHLIHGQEDADVPWETALQLAKCVMGEEVLVTLVKDGDHRLNRPADLALLMEALARMRAEER